MDFLNQQEKCKSNMENANVKYKNITIAFFSGTGCTETVADCLHQQLAETGLDINKIKISCDSSSIGQTDLLMILSPVYAFSLADIVEKWIKNLPDTNKTSVAIIPVSGGGDVSPNTACTVRSRKLLKRKGYDVIYEKMIAMPSNFGAPTPDQLAVRLINILPFKIKAIISDILSERRIIAHPKFQDRFFAAAGKMEHFGAKIFGSSIKVSDSCNKCGLCIKNCPENNISMKNGKIKFGFKCILCLKCIYGCPCGALNPGIMKSTIIKDGFSINKVKQMAEAQKNDKIEDFPKNVLWNGLIKYLEE